MKKYKFVLDIWVTFIYNGNKCIGRTIMIEGEPIISMVNHFGQIGHIPFVSATELKKLDILNESEGEELIVKSNEDYDKNDLGVIISIFGQPSGLN